MTKDSEFLTIAEAAALLRLGERTTYRLVQAGVLPAVHLGRAVRVPRSALLQYMERMALAGVVTPKGAVT